MADRPPPLTDSECTRLWAWEERLRRYYIAASVGMMLAVAVLAWVDSVMVRRGVVAVVIALFAGAAYLQSREKCPRCGSRLRFRSRLTMTDLCRTCGVLFPRPPDSVWKQPQLPEGH